MGHNFLSGSNLTGEMMGMTFNEEAAGYYCLLIAICCDLNAHEARLVYEHGFEYPPCKRILKKKVKLPEGFKAASKHQVGEWMRQLRMEGFSLDAISEAFGCYPSAVRRRISKAESEATVSE